MNNSKDRLGRLERIIETQSLLAQADLDLPAFMQLVVDKLQEQTMAKGAVVELVDGDHMVYSSASGAISAHVGLRLLRGNSLSGLCVSTAQSLRCDDAETDPRVDANACRKVGVRSMICSPLFQRGVPVGVLKVMSERPDNFDDDDVKTLDLMGAALGAELGKQVIFDEMDRVQAQLHASEERIRTILEFANDAVISIDQSGIVTQWNRSSERLFGWTKAEAVGRDVADLVVRPDLREAFKSALTHTNSVAETEIVHRREFLAVDRSGKELSVEASLNVNNNAGRTELTAFLHDISERKKFEVTLREMALSDGLTGLPNRRRFMESLNQAIVRHHRQNNGLALLYMDLNGFKEINDTHGHEMGDLVLKEFACRLAGCLRETDMVARLGGDEFVLLAEGIHIEKHAQIVAEKIIATLDDPVPGTAVLIATSIGISIYDGTRNAAQFLREADTAMYQAKQNKSNNSAIATLADKS